MKNERGWCDTKKRRPQKDVRERTPEREKVLWHQRSSAGSSSQLAWLVAPSREKLRLSVFLPLFRLSFLMQTRCKRQASLGFLAWTDALRRRLIHCRRAKQRRTRTIRRGIGRHNRKKKPTKPEGRARHFSAFIHARACAAHASRNTCRVKTLRTLHAIFRNRPPPNPCAMHFRTCRFVLSQAFAFIVNDMIPPAPTTPRFRRVSSKTST